MSRNLILTRENLLTRSEEFDHADWVKTGTPVTTANSTLAPDGTLTADTLEDNNAAAYEYYGQTNSGLIPASIYIASIFVKKDSIGRATRFPMLSLGFSGSTAEGNDLRFDTKTAEVDFSGSDPSIVGFVIDHNADYWRVYIKAKSQDQSNTSVIFTLWPVRGASSSWVKSAAAVGSIIVWGAQLTKGEALLPYSKSVASAIAGPFAGLVIIPEYDYKDTGQKFESRHRVRSGAEYVYKWGEWSEKKMSVAFVNSEFKSVVNSWWSSNTDLEFQEGLNISSVHLINKSKPVDGLVKPYNDLFRGKIELGTY